MKYKLTTLFLVAACASTPTNLDPHKDFNETMLEVNLSLDRNILKPASHLYEDMTNRPVQLMFSNFLSNLKEPFYLVNYILQIDDENMASSIFRFLVNSTLGIFGFFDIAELMGVPKHSTGHKDTLRKMEIPHGDYIVLPVFGPSSTRDTIAEPISWFADPVAYFIGWPITISKTVLQMIVDRYENSALIDSTLSESENVYSTLRSVYLQKYGIKDDISSSENGLSPDNEDSAYLLDDGPSPDDELE